MAEEVAVITRNLFLRGSLPIGMIKRKHAVYWISRIESRIRAYRREVFGSGVKIRELNHCLKCGGVSKRSQRAGHRICVDCRDVFASTDDPFHTFDRSRLISMDDIFADEVQVRRMITQDRWPHYERRFVKTLELTNG